MTDSHVEAVVDALLRARAEGRPRAAAEFAHSVTTFDEAYAVQAEVARSLRWFDAEVPLHWKSGGPSRDAVLTHAALPPRGVWASPAQAHDWPFTLRGIEAEVALRLGRSVGAAQAAALDEVSAAELVEALAVSIEIVDSRWAEGMAAPALLRLADLQSHGALVLGAWRPYAPRDWAHQTCRVSIGTRAAVERRGTHALGSPLWGLGAWLRHATREGGVVRAGTVLTTGTWVGVLDAAAGERVHVEFDGIGDAEVLL